MKGKRRGLKLSKKGTTLKREAKGLVRSGASFVPGLGLALSVQETARRANRTIRAVRDYGKELFK